MNNTKLILLTGLILGAAQYAQAASLKCTGTDDQGAVTVTLSASVQIPGSGQKVHVDSANYQVEHDSKVCAGDPIPGSACPTGDNYSRQQRPLQSLDISASDLGTVYTGTYQEEYMGYDSAGTFNLTLTAYSDPTTNSKIVVTHSYYSEANGNVTDTVLSLANLTCTSGS
jgi:hypothetical protein